MDAHIKKVYVPMTETAFYILLGLEKPNHGYGIVQMVEKMTAGEIRLAPGTMYGSLSKMEKDGLIRFTREEDKRKSTRSPIWGGRSSRWNAGGSNVFTGTAGGRMPNERRQKHQKGLQVFYDLRV